MPSDELRNKTEKYLNAAIVAQVITLIIRWIVVLAVVIPYEMKRFDDEDLKMVTLLGYSGVMAIITIISAGYLREVNSYRKTKKIGGRNIIWACLFSGLVSVVFVMIAKSIYDKADSMDKENEDALNGRFHYLEYKPVSKSSDKNMEKESSMPKETKINVVKRKQSKSSTKLDDEIKALEEKVAKLKQARDILEEYNMDISSLKNDKKR